MLFLLCGFLSGIDINKKYSTKPNARNTMKMYSKYYRIANQLSKINPEVLTKSQFSQLSYSNGHRPIGWRECKNFLMAGGALTMDTPDSPKIAYLPDLGVCCNLKICGQGLFAKFSVFLKT